MGVFNLEYRGIKVIIVTSDEQRRWTWAFMAEGLGLEYGAEFSITSEEEAYTEAKRRAASFIDAHFVRP